MNFLTEQPSIQLLTETLNMIESGAVITDASKPDNPIVFMNDGFAHITGYTREEVLGKNCRFLQGEKTDSLSVQTMRQSIKEARPFQHTLLNYRKDGTPFWNKVDIKPVWINDTLYFIGLQYDVTDKVHLNVDIETARKEIEDLSIPIILLDDETMVVPLVGQMDATRSLLLMDKLSKQLYKTDVEKVIVDVTGLFLETDMSKQWIQNLQHTARLLGAEVVVSGISPKMAFHFNQTIHTVYDMTFYSSLQAALKVHGKSSS